MNVAIRDGVSLAEFLAWERAQPARFEFDGRQPIPMNAGTVAHARLISRLLQALARSLPCGFEAFPGELKVVTPAGQVRYPDVSVVAAGAEGTADHIAPVAVFEVLSASTRLVDLQVKPAEYATVPSILLYVILATDSREVAIVRRRNGWAPDPAVVTLDLSEIGVTLDLADLYAGP